MGTKSARSLAADLLRFIASHDGRTLTDDDLAAWTFPVEENPTVWESDWREAISRHYAAPDARRARTGDILAEAKALRDRRNRAERPAIESNPDRVPCPPELRYLNRRAS